MNQFLKAFIPFTGWWPEVNRRTLRADAIAGLTGAVVVLPQGVAFATLAGMPPVYGLYAAMIPAIFAALFGSSRYLVSGPTTAASIVVFSSLSTLAQPGSADYITYALTLTFMVGAIELTMGFARLGALVNFISHSVVVGFTAGAAILIATSQLKHFFGLVVPSGLDFHEVVFYFFTHLPQISPAATLVAFSTVAAGLLCRRYFRRFPYLIAAMLVGMFVSTVMNIALRAGGSAELIPVVGFVPATLPPLSSPDFSLSTMKQLAPAAFAVTLFALTEAVSIARSLAARSGDTLDGNQEFVGQGLSNIVGSFFSSYVATGSFNRSGLNFESGACTPLAAVFSGALLIVVVLLVAPLLAYLPYAAMAGVLFMVAWGIVDVKHIRQILKASRSDSMVMGATFGATLLFELDFAILLGVFLSLVLYLHRASQPRVRVRVPDPRHPKRQFTTDPLLPECPQLKVIRIDGPLFFGAVSYVAERLRVIFKHSPDQKHLLVLARPITFIDVAGAELLAREGRIRRRTGGGLYFHQLSDSAQGVLRRGGYLPDIGEDHFFGSKGDAISGIFGRLDKSICRKCDKRIFNECKSVEREGEAAKPATAAADD
ncbi:MAG: SulP family inorganic anion transporter [Gammaproteobacteria bacterium]|nr:SulP family inorganic anion transporter [Gammaproteobacteria bacterium]